MGFEEIILHGAVRLRASDDGGDRGMEGSVRGVRVRCQARDGERREIRTEGP
jgi:hypothetical protein